ncbi:ABC transporter permease [Lactococcus garvieae]|uniref:ABC transporter permease n=1 Tax=Lactococcus formosensis TaxID=1281486 RepID=UPI0013FD65CD|nr:ABC transporter permease [Lactococcus garvieae]
MDFIRRAWLFTKAKLSRTLLLIVAFSTILIFVLSGLVIHTASNRSIENAKKSAGATVTLSINRSAMMENFSKNDSTGKTNKSDIPDITQADAEKIAKLSGVKSYSYTKQATANAESNIEAISQSDTSKNNDKTYKMTVVGLYKSGSTENDLAADFSFMNPANQMYTALSVPNQIDGKTGTLGSAIFNLENPEDSEKFVKEATKLIDTDKFEVQSNDAIYQQMLQPLNNISSFSKNIVILVTLAGAIILALIVMLMVRERRFEIGVLMSLGESKGKIVMQFFTELFMIMVVSIGIASATGNFVGNAVGQQLLNQETQTSQTNQPTQINGTQRQEDGPQTEKGSPNAQPGGMRTAIGMGQNNEQLKAINELEIKTNPQQIAILAALALLITLVAVGLAAIGILRLNPKQVLTN